VKSHIIFINANNLIWTRALQKRSENPKWVMLRGLYTILTEASIMKWLEKEKSIFRLLGAINCGKLTRKYEE
jgi:hypothetical protein